MRHPARAVRMSTVVRAIARAVVVLGIAASITGCVGTMLPGHIYDTTTGKTLPFAIQTSRGHGTMTAVDSASGENFTGEYYGTYLAGDISVPVNSNGSSMIVPPNGANAHGILTGNHGTVITVYFVITPGLRPTGYGKGVDNHGGRYEFYF